MSAKISDTIYAALREQIITGALAGGEKLRQDHIARDFETSHVPVREALLRLEGHEGYVYSLDFSPDGSWIVTGSGDGTVRVWDAGATPRRWRESIRASDGYERSERVAEEFLRQHGREALRAAVVDEGLSAEDRRLVTYALARRGVEVESPGR